MNENTYSVLKAEDVLSGLTYPGRGIVLGVTPNGKYAVAAYFISGRSENSRNRVFSVSPDGTVKTEPFDLSKVSDPSLIIYNAVRFAGKDLVVTNGDQTDTVCDGIAEGKTFTEALASRCFEPDAPNFTPRISGIFYFGKTPRYEMSILKSVDETGSDCARYTFSYPMKAGLGYFIRTYENNGDPLPTFRGEPVRVATDDDLSVFSEKLWNSLDKENKISLYVRYTDLSDLSYKEKLYNKHVK